MATGNSFGTRTALSVGGRSLQMYSLPALQASGFPAVDRLPAWPVWVAVAWSGMEVLRSTWPFSGMPWGRLAFAVVDTPVAPALDAMARAMTATIDKPVLCIRTSSLPWEALETVAPHS